MINPGEFQKIANSDEVGEGDSRPFNLEGHRIALVRHEGKIYAIEDRCPHADATLAFGMVDNGAIACPWHFAEFRLETGEVLSGPACENIGTYEVRESDGAIEVRLGAPPPLSLHKIHPSE